MIAPVIIGSLVLLAFYAGAKRASPPLLGMVILFAVVGSAVTVSPSLATRAAQALNVGRGTDLLLYVAILTGAFVCSNFYLRFRRSEQQMAELARKIAIGQAQPPTSPSHSQNRAVTLADRESAG